MHFHCEKFKSNSSAESGIGSQQRQQQHRTINSFCSSRNESQSIVHTLRIFIDAINSKLAIVFIVLSFVLAQTLSSGINYYLAKWWVVSCTRVVFITHPRLYEYAKAVAWEEKNWVIKKVRVGVDISPLLIVYNFSHHFLYPTAAKKKFQITFTRLTGGKRVNCVESRPKKINSSCELSLKYRAIDNLTRILPTFFFSALYFVTSETFTIETCPESQRYWFFIRLSISIHSQSLHSFIIDWSYTLVAFWPIFPPFIFTDEWKRGEREWRWETDCIKAWTKTVSRVNEVAESRAIDNFITINVNTTDARVVHSCRRNEDATEAIDWCWSLALFAFIALFSSLLMGLARLMLFFKCFKRFCVNIHDKYFCRLTRASMVNFHCESSKATLSNIFAFDVPVIDTRLPCTCFELLLVSS